MQAHLGEFGASLDLRHDSASAVELASRRHWDGILIDCDDVPGGTEAITQMRSSRSNREVLIFAVVNGMTSTGAALDLGASFVLSKPLEDGRLRSVLDAAIPKMEREHRRYFRFEADLPVECRNYDGETFTARMKNVSEGGLAIKPLAPVTPEGVVIVEFQIPSVEPTAFRAKAEVVWRDSFAVGLRFLYIDKDSGCALQAWFNSLEAQLRFRASS